MDDRKRDAGCSAAQAGDRMHRSAIDLRLLGILAQCSILCALKSHSCRFKCAQALAK